MPVPRSFVRTLFALPLVFASVGGCAPPTDPADLPPSPPGEEPTPIVGAYLEPPAGRVLHGMGQWAEGNDNFLAALDQAGASDILPASELDFLALGVDDEPGTRGWSWGLNSLDEYLQACTFELTAEEVEAISQAGAVAPRRFFWSQCPQFCEDPRQESASPA